MTVSTNVRQRSEYPFVASPIAICIVLLLSVATFCAWRLLLCSWARFPGPKLAALTSWYEWYYDVYRHGQLTKHLEELHQVYGPVVRYGPKHVHFHDPYLYPAIYRWRDSFAKDPAYYRTPKVSSTFRQADILKHAVRRRVLDKVFNLNAIRQQQGSIQDQFNHMACKLRRLTDAPVNVFNLARALGADLLCLHVLGINAHFMDEEPDCFDGRFILAVQNTTTTSWPKKNEFLQFWRRLKDWLGLTDPALKQNEKILDEMTYSNKLMDEFWTCQVESSPELRGGGALSILLRSDAGKNFQAVSRPEVIAEGRSLIAAGVNTVGWTIGSILCFIARDSRVQDLLRKELDAQFSSSDAISYQELSELPYLSACIKEGYRMAATVPGRLPRIVWPQGAQIGDHFIPGGTIIGMSANSCHFCSEIFENPSEYLPERWINNDKNTIKFMNANLLPFGRGARECLGRHMAHAIICITIGGLVKQFTLALPPDYHEPETIASIEQIPKNGRMDLVVKPRG